MMRDTTILGIVGIVAAGFVAAIYFSPKKGATTTAAPVVYGPPSPVTAHIAAQVAAPTPMVGMGATIDIPDTSSLNPPEEDYSSFIA